MGARMENRRTVMAAVAVVALAALIVVTWSASILGEDRYSEELATFRAPPYAAGTEAVPEIASGVTVGASFLATEDDLTGIDVRMATNGRLNSGSLIFTLATSLTGAPLRTLQLPSANIRPDLFHRFAFEPIEDSAGQTYYLTLAAPGVETGNGVSPWTQDCNCEPSSELYINGERQDQRELAMSVVYRAETRGTLWELINRMSQYKPELVKGVGFLLISLVAVGLSLLAVGVFTKRVMQTPVDEPEAPWRWVLASLPFVAYFATLIW